MKADDQCKMLRPSRLTLLHRGRDGGVAGRDDEPFRAVDDPPLLPREVRCCVEALQGDGDQRIKNALIFVKMAPASGARSCNRTALHSEYYVMPTCIGEWADTRCVE